MDSKTNEFIEKAIEKHGKQYDYTEVKYITAKNKVIIKCRRHGKFLQTPNKHLSGQGCRKCGIERRNLMKRYTTRQFIRKSKLIHGNNYIYDKVNYKYSKTLVIIICRKHGEFRQKPVHHLQGLGCQICGGSKQSSTAEFIKKSIKIHGNRYDYSKVNYINNKLQVIIICKKHGEFLQIPSHHLDGNNCDKCAKNHKYTTLEFIEIANKIHNNIYNYSQSEYINLHTKIKIICKIHGIFYQTPGKHIHGKQGCRKCNNIGYSKKSIEWLDYMAKKNNTYIQHAENEGEYRIENKRVDGYCKDNNTVYEFHGCLFHGCFKCFDKDKINPFIKKCKNKDLYIKTLEREKWIKSMGYNLVVIWEHDWNSLSKKLGNKSHKLDYVSLLTKQIIKNIAENNIIKSETLCNSYNNILKVNNIKSKKLII